MTTQVDNRTFLTWLTLALILASMWIFKSYLHYILVATVLALATSNLFAGFTGLLVNDRTQGFVHNNSDVIGDLLIQMVWIMVFYFLLNS